MASRPSEASLRLALPSKAMEQETLEFLKACGLAVDRTSPRQYRASIPTLPGVEVLFQRADDIFSKVQEGSADAGITGYDVVEERRREEDDVVLLYPELGYGRCSLVVAVPEAWIDVVDMSDLAEVASDFWRRGSELRLATKYTNLAREFLYRHGISHFSLVESHGALEAAPSMGYADAIADLMSSGVTLRENRLKPVEGGAIVESQACFIGNRRQLGSDRDKLATIRAMLELVEGYLRSRKYSRITANVKGESELAVARRVTAQGEIAGLQGPTISRVYPKTAQEGGWLAVTVVVDNRSLLSAVESLRRTGASEVSVSSLAYVFESKCWSFENLMRHLEGLPAAWDEERRRGRSPRLR